MGKTAKKFTEEVIKQGELCGQFAADLHKAVEELKIMIEKWETAARPYRDRFHQLYLEGLKDDDAMIQHDPDFKLLLDEYNEVEEERVAIMRRGRKAVKKLQESLGPLGVTVQDFEEYAKKKAKSWKSKTSLKESERTINSYKQVEQGLKTTLADLRTHFPA